MTRIVFLEDDPFFASDITRSLEARGFAVTHCSTGQACLSHLQSHQYDVGLFDWHLPDLKGPEVMRRLRQMGCGLPIIFMTGHDAESDVVEMLMTGADDYIIKPPVIAVLFARIQALLRRVQPPSKVIQTERLNHLLLDYQNKIIFSHGQPVPLTGTQALLAFDLFAQRGQIVTREHLYRLLGVNRLAVDTRRLDVHISHLRRKLELNAVNGWRLSSIYQRGYRLECLHEG